MTNPFFGRLLQPSPLSLSDTEDLSSEMEYVPSNIDLPFDIDEAKGSKNELFFSQSLESRRGSFTPQVSAPIVRTNSELTNKCKGNP